MKDALAGADRYLETAGAGPLLQDGHKMALANARGALQRNDLSPARLSAVVADATGLDLAVHLVDRVARIVLDTKRHVLDVVMVYQGNISSAIVRPAELLRDAVIANAPALVLTHNHPSGDPEPSPQDVRMTKDLVEAADVLGIELADHVVIGHGSFVSLKQRGLL